MKIGVIGAGNIGATLGTLWAKAGHEVRFGTRHPDQLTVLIETIGAGASAGRPADAAAFGEVIFTAIPYGAWPDLANSIAGDLAGKILIDAANPYPARDGAFAEGAMRRGEGAGVPIAGLLPAARLVRGFNTVFWKMLASEAHRPGDKVGIPLASDDMEAIAIAAGLVRDAGFEPVAVGPLVEARRFDAGSAVYNTGMTGPELTRALGLNPGKARE